VEGLEGAVTANVESYRVHDLTKVYPDRQLALVVSMGTLPSRSSSAALSQGERKSARPFLSARSARAWRARWDRQQETGIPEREFRFEAILETLGTAVGPRFRVLDLGCGTGSLSERILRRFPAARSVAVDHDPVLLKIGRVGLGDLGGRLRWVDADLARAGWAEGLPVRRFDAAVSTTALHWLNGPQLSRLYREVRRLLRPGGWFLNGDQLAYPKTHPTLRDLSNRVRRARASPGRKRGESWDDWWRAVLADSRFAVEAELRRRRYPHSHSETPTPDLPGHERRLKAAGFREVDLVWTQWDNRVLAAVR
jgi:SAM-dependent methyltransferase